MSATFKQGRKKCNAVNAKWCAGVEAIFTFGNPDKKGLNVAGAIDIKTHARGHGLLVRGSEVGTVWLNYCPFCGADVKKRTKKRT